jgi:hypothetical protein
MATDDQPSASTASDPQSLAIAPAAMLATLYGAIGLAMGDAALNAAAAQQQAQTLAQATVTQGVALLYSVDTAALGLATEKEIDKK